MWYERRRSSCRTINRMISETAVHGLHLGPALVRWARWTCTRGTLTWSSGTASQVHSVGLTNDSNLLSTYITFATRVLRLLPTSSAQVQQTTTRNGQQNAIQKTAEQRWPRSYAQGGSTYHLTPLPRAGKI